MKTILFSLILLLGFSSGRSHAQQIIETEPLAPFGALKISGPIKLELIPADESRMQMMLWELDAKNINWRIKDNILTVETRKGLVNKRAFADIKLYYKELSHIAISGSEVMTKEAIVTGSLYLTAEDAVGSMDLAVECTDLTIHTSGNNTVKVSGSADDAIYQARLGSKIDCMNLAATNVDATASGRSEVLVRANEVLDAKASTGGNVFFIGEPVTLRIKKSTMGGVESVNNL